MIERYQSREISEIFSDKNKFSLFLEIEALVLEVLSKRHPIRKEEIGRLRGLKSKVDPKAIARIEEKTRHDITAFLSWVWDSLPKEKGVKQFLHYGLTSSDLVDTALAAQMQAALDSVIQAARANQMELERLSKKYQSLPAIGRTHGIHAEITSLGLKFLSFYSEGRRALRRLESAKEEIAYGKLSGSVGSFSSSVISPQEEAAVLAKLGLKAEPVSTQVAPRDRHASVLSSLALLGGWGERIALEIRLSQQSELGELAEPFAEGAQQGSSSMPHKRNPVLCENLCGLARLLRSYALVGFENTALWHERDISHSSSERVAVADAFHAAHFMMKRLHKILSGLMVNPERIERNLTLLMDLPSSQKYLNALIGAGLERAAAYKMIQRSSFRALENKSSLFKELSADPELPKNSRLKRFEAADSLNAVSVIFKRTLKNS